MATRPSPLLKAAFRIPTWLYRIGLGWVLGKRLLALTHLGRRSGRRYVSVLEVVAFDSSNRESIVVSAYGTRADWYRNIKATPALRVRTGRLNYVPDQRFLSADEAKEVAAEFCTRHPWEAKLAPRVLPAIGAAVPVADDPVELIASLPMVGFRPVS